MNSLLLRALSRMTLTENIPPISSEKFQKELISKTANERIPDMRRTEPDCSTISGYGCIGKSTRSPFDKYPTALVLLSVFSLAST